MGFASEKRTFTWGKMLEVRAKATPRLKAAGVEEVLAATGIIV